MHDRGAGFVTYFFFGVGIVICDVALLVLPLGEHVPFQLLQVGQSLALLVDRRDRICDAVIGDRLGLELLSPGFEVLWLGFEIMGLGFDVLSPKSGTQSRDVLS